jgi:polysaccharide biosynthesis/export protein
MIGMNLIASLGLALALAPQGARGGAQPAPPPATQGKPAPSPTTPGKPAAPATTSRNYVIGPQDQLLITVFEEPGLSNKYRVENDGFITFPYLERVPAAGKTLSQLQELLTTMLANGWLRNPQVRVEIDQYKSQSIIVTGQVRMPNEYTMTGASMTLMQALAAAGSPTADASNEVIISRRTQKPGQEREIIRVNRKELELGLKDVALQDGDVINVPKAQTFFVDGYVRNPGSYVLDPGLTVQQAIALAGGLTERGSDRRIRASRLVKDRLVEIPIRLEDLVQAGDTIKVGARFF